MDMNYNKDAFGGIDFILRTGADWCPSFSGDRKRIFKNALLIGAER